MDEIEEIQKKEVIDALQLNSQNYVVDETTKTTKIPREWNA